MSGYIRERGNLEDKFLEKVEDTLDNLYRLRDTLEKNALNAVKESTALDLEVVEEINENLKETLLVSENLGIYTMTMRDASEEYNKWMQSDD